MPNEQKVSQPSREVIEKAIHKLGLFRVLLLSTLAIIFLILVPVLYLERGSQVESLTALQEESEDIKVMQDSFTKKHVGQFLSQRYEMQSRVIADLAAVHLKEYLNCNSFCEVKLRNMKEELGKLFKDPMIKYIHIRNLDYNHLIGLYRNGFGGVTHLDKHIELDKNEFESFIEPIAVDGIKKGLIFISYKKEVIDLLQKELPEFMDRLKKNFKSTHEEVGYNKFFYSLIGILLVLASFMVAYYYLIKVTISQPVNKISEESTMLSQDFSSLLNISYSEHHDLKKISKGIIKIKKSLMKRIFSLEKVNYVSGQITRSDDRSRIKELGLSGIKEALSSQSISFISEDGLNKKLALSGSIQKHNKQNEVNLCYVLQANNVKREIIIPFPLENEKDKYICIQESHTLENPFELTYSVTKALYHVMDSSLINIEMHDKLESKSKESILANFRLHNILQIARYLFISRSAEEATLFSCSQILKDLAKIVGQEPELKLRATLFLKSPLPEEDANRFTFLLHLKDIIYLKGSLKKSRRIHTHILSRLNVEYPKNLPADNERNIIFDLKKLGGIEGHLHISFLQTPKIDKASWDFAVAIARELSLSLENIKKNKEHIQSELKMTRARLEELGKVAVYLGDKLASPLNILSLIAEDLQDYVIEKQTPKNEDLEIMATKVEKAVFRLAGEVHALKKYREYAPSAGTIAELAQQSDDTDKPQKKTPSEETKDSSEHKEAS